MRTKQDWTTTSKKRGVSGGGRTEAVFPAPYRTAHRTGRTAGGFRGASPGRPGFGAAPPGRAGGQGQGARGGAGGFKLQVTLERILPSLRVALKHPYSREMNDLFRRIEGAACFFDPKRKARILEWPALKQLYGMLGELPFPVEVEDLPKFLKDGIPRMVARFRQAYIENRSSATGEDPQAAAIAASAGQPPAERVRLILPPKLDERLLPFQREGVSFVVAAGGRGLIADEMGCGKTVQGIAFAAHYRSEWPLLVIAPAGVRANWKKELLRFLPDAILSEDEVKVLTKKSDDVAGAPCLIVSWDMLSDLTRRGALRPQRFRTVIGDESHYIKSIDAKRTRAALPLLRNAKRLLLLSGTPALSRPAELWPQLHAIAHDSLFPERAQREYARRYCNAHEGHFGWDEKGSSNEEELAALLRESVMIRRLKADVLKSCLPAKVRNTIYVEAPAGLQRDIDEKMDALNTLELSISQAAKRYGEGADDVLRQLKADRDALMMRLWEAAGKAKAPAIVRRLAELLRGGAAKAPPRGADAEVLSDDDILRELEGGGGGEGGAGGGQGAAEAAPGDVRKVLVFATHMAVLDQLENAMLAADVAYIRIDGHVPAAKRQPLVDRFQDEEEVEVALLGVKACNTGVSFTAANYAIFAELMWTPGDMRQAEDRIHRMGQTSPKVYYDVFICKNSYDERHMRLLQSKDSMLAATIGTADIRSPGADVSAAAAMVKKPPSSPPPRRDRAKALPAGQRTLAAFVKRPAAPAAAPPPKRPRGAGGGEVVDLAGREEDDEGLLQALVMAEAKFAQDESAGRRMSKSKARPPPPPPPVEVIDLDLDEAPPPPVPPKKAPALSPSVLARMEANRRAALERRAKRMQARRPEAGGDPSAQPPPPHQPPQPPQPPQPLQPLPGNGPAVEDGPDAAAPQKASARESAALPPDFFSAD